jgi:arylsulfatase
MIPRTQKVILIVIDTLRADHLGCYGYVRDTSPNIDRFAENASMFCHAFTPVSFTLPAIASLMTSKRPMDHSICFNQLGALSDSDLTVAELFHDCGRHTAAFVSTIVLRKKTRLNLGFELYDDNVFIGEMNRPEMLWRDGRETTANALQYIEQHADKSFFVFIHLMDVHGPYACPPPYDSLFINDRFYGEKTNSLKIVSFLHPYFGIPDCQVLGASGANRGDFTGFIDDPRYYVAQYDGAIRKCDDIIGSFLDGLRALKIYDDALIALTSDHGEALGENNVYFFHGVTVTPDQLHVPLIIKPRVDATSVHRRLTAPVSTMDIAPTILSECGIQCDDLALYGRPLQRMMNMGIDPVITGRTLMGEIESQHAYIKPDGRLVLHKTGRLTRYYSSIPELVDRLNHLQYDWRTGRKISPEGVSPA